MSFKVAPISSEIFDYIAERTQGEDEHLAALRAAAFEAEIPAISINPAQGSLLQILLRLAGCRTVVEVGTLAGYSATWMARALPADGMVHTIEFSQKHAEFARSWVARSDVADRITVHHGAGVEVLATLADDSADAFFIDADKANYPRYLEEAIRILRPGGLVMVDNAFAFGHLLDPAEQSASVAAIRFFNDYMAAHEGVSGSIVAVGDGMWVGVTGASPR